MSGMEEYEHFSDEFMEYWKKPGNSREIEIIQTYFYSDANEQILRNMQELEKCIEKNTKNIKTDTNYDIKFECRGLKGLPGYKVIDQGYGDISKPLVSDEHTKIKYLGKPLKNIGLNQSTDIINGPGKNEFVIHPSPDFNEPGYYGYIEIRISNSNIPSNLDIPKNIEKNNKKYINFSDFIDYSHKKKN